MYSFLEDSEKIKYLKAWHNAQVVSGYDSSVWRKDTYGYWIRFSDLGNRISKHGWKTDISQLNAKEFVAVHYANARLDSDVQQEYCRSRYNIVAALSVIALATLGLVL